jgi:hypothetical protein
MTAMKRNISQAIHLFPIFKSVVTVQHALILFPRECADWKFGFLGNHTEDQGANLFADTLPSYYSSES